MTNIVLTGFMGTGKTTVGRILATRYGMQFVDTDEEVERRAGCSVADIFAEGGEQRFRELESRVLQEALAGPERVVATGGGSLVSSHNRDLLQPDHTVICLTCDLATIEKRVGTAGTRPLFSGGQPEAVIELLAEREQTYALYPQIDTTGCSPHEVVNAIATLSAPQLAASFTVAQAQKYDVLFEAGLAGRAGTVLPALGLTGQVLLLTDSHVARLDLFEAVQSSLRSAGFVVSTHVFPEGEQHKTLATLEGAYAAALSAGLDRESVVVGVGGGVVGDMAGMVAATYLRGLSLVLLPTTLLAQVDAAIGGKVGVDFRTTKNMIGAFKPARLVLIDPLTLTTLPSTALADGVAEIIKIGYMRAPHIVAQLSDLDLDEILDHSHVIRSAAREKVDVVRTDPLERSERMLLNFGHTIGHGLEAASDYRLSHGRSVSIGMVAETRMAVARGWCRSSTLEMLINLLRRFSLPTELESIDPDRVLRFVAQDKKRRAGKIRLAIPREIGSGVVVEVTLDDVGAALGATKEM